MTGEATWQELTLTRVLEAPRERVWSAWTEPEQLTRWWGNTGWVTPLATIALDVRPGGRFALTNLREADGREMAQEAIYREVVAPERLVFDEPAETNWHEGAVSTVTLVDLGEDRTEMTFNTVLRTRPEHRDLAGRGLSNAFDRLAGGLSA